MGRTEAKVRLVVDKAIAESGLCTVEIRTGEQARKW